MKLIGRLALFAVFGVATSASATLVVSGGPSTSPPGGGSCSVTTNAVCNGLACQAPDGTGGVTITCSGLTPSAVRHLWYGINNAPISPNGDSMQSHNPVTGTEIFRYSSNTANSITYSGTTTIHNAQTSANSSVSEANVLVFQSGTGSMVCDGTTTFDSGANGDVRCVWQVTSTSFTTTANVNASGSNAIPTVFNPTQTTNGAQEVDHVSLAFYWDSCGNGVREGTEQCDDGANNGTAGDCCDINCNFKTLGTVCRPSTGTCDGQETCTGTSGACPPDTNFASSSTVCRPVAGSCDQAENCTGSSNTCPTDTFLNSSTVCRGIAGPCDQAENCTGTSANCPADMFLPSSTVCRPAANECDVADNCTGGGSACPSDTVVAAGTGCTDDGNPCTTDLCNGTMGSPACDHDPGNAGAVCHVGSGDVCDPQQTCTGASATCPSDLKSSSFVCRAAVDECDAAETCPGVANQPCPGDQKETAGTPCNDDGNPCTADQCDGTTDTCQHPAGNAGAVCRPPAGACDVAETCDGNSATCPADQVEPAGTECRPVAGDCDVAEDCDGSSPNCPADGFKSSSVACRPSAGPCDVIENCTGTSANCPPDAFHSVSGAFICRPAAGPCDAADTCDGSGSACPADAKEPNSTVCRPAAGVCDAAENCDGLTNNCPPDLKKLGDVCRPAADQCDVQETCDGVSDTCPANGFVPNGTPCDDTNTCTNPDACQSGVCTGTPNLNTCENHWLCYKSKDAATFNIIPFVNLDDTFVSNTDYNLLKPVYLCTPANKNSEGILDPVTHQRVYKIKAVSSAPRFVKVTNINTVNQFGPLIVDVVKPDLLFVPTAKSISSPPGPLPPNTIDHYKCYKTRVTRGTAKFVKTTVTIADQFRQTMGNFDVKTPKHFCTPVSKNHETVYNANAYLLCYNSKPQRGVPKHTGIAPVYLQDQFGPWTIATVREQELCVPTLRQP